MRPVQTAYTKTSSVALAALVVLTLVALRANAESVLFPAKRSVDEQSAAAAWPDGDRIYTFTSVSSPTDSSRVHDETLTISGTSWAAWMARFKDGSCLKLEEGRLSSHLRNCANEAQWQLDIGPPGMSGANEVLRPFAGISPEEAEYQPLSPSPRMADSLSRAVAAYDGDPEDLAMATHSSDVDCIATGYEWCGGEGHLVTERESVVVERTSLMPIWFQRTIGSVVVLEVELTASD